MLGAQAADGRQKELAGAPLTRSGPTRRPRGAAQDENASGGLLGPFPPPSCGQESAICGVLSNGSHYQQVSMPLILEDWLRHLSSSRIPCARGIAMTLPFRVCSIFAGGFLVLSCAHASAAIVTTFEGSMQPGTPAAGWQYLWNRDGAMGNPSNYAPLRPTGSPYYFYDADGADGLPGAGDPAAFVYFGVLDPSRPYPADTPGGHPAHGYTQAGTNAIERFAIAAFTLPTTGFVSILDSELENADTSLDGLHLQVYVGNDPTPLVDTYTASGLGSLITFDGALGFRNAGDTIYVAIGANGDDFYDTFRLAYSIDIAAVPEPSTLVVVGSGAICIAMSHLIRRRLRKD